jgi:uncharacterized protein
VRVVLDAGALAAAFAFPGGQAERVYRAVVEGRAELVTSRPLLAELGRVLSDGFRDSRAAAEALAQVMRLGSVVDPAERIRLVEADPGDDRVLEAAVAGGAEIVVARDRHLLRLGSWRGIRIVSPSRFPSEQATTR